MKLFDPGEFDRAKVRRWARGFCPARSVAELSELEPQALYDAGKRLVLLDMDNTLVGWRSEEIPASTREWIATAQGVGLQLCVISNTRHPARLARLAKEMKIDYRTGKFKPSRTMYLAALAHYAATPDQAVMIGDQIFTDIWGANRSGIEAVLVARLTPRDFVATKLSRLGERLLRPHLRRGHRRASNESSQ